MNLPGGGHNSTYNKQGRYYSREKKHMFKSLSYDGTWRVGETEGWWSAESGQGRPREETLWQL